MTYITGGIFWPIIIIIGVAIGIIYYLLNKKVEKNTSDITKICQVISKMAEIADQEFAEVRKEAHRSNAEIYENVANAFEEIENKNRKGGSKKHAN